MIRPSLKTVLRTLLVLWCAIPFSGNAQYKISGQLTNYDSLWHSNVILSALNSTRLLTTADADFEINKGLIDKEGHFTLSGNNLPDEERIYRLDLTNQNSGVMMQGGASSNSIYFILNNHSAVNIVANNFSKQSYSYKVEGSDENAALQKFEEYLYTLHQLSNTPSPSKMSEEYAIDKFNSSLRAFADSSKYPTLSLIAIANIIDFEKDDSLHADFYKQFSDKIKAIDPNSIYTKEFEKKLNQLGATNQTHTGIWISIAGLIVLILSIYIWYVKRAPKQASVTASNETTTDNQVLFNTLTRREKEILALLIEDMPNKEIAGKLNLEVSTIKTHIGNIYQKLSIGNRNEVKIFEAFIKNKVD